MLRNIKKIVALPFIYINDFIADLLFTELTLDFSSNYSMVFEQFYWKLYIHCVLSNDEWQEWINK